MSQGKFVADNTITILEGSSFSRAPPTPASTTVQSNFTPELLLMEMFAEKDCTDKHSLDKVKQQLSIVLSKLPIARCHKTIIITERDSSLFC